MIPLPLQQMATTDQVISLIHLHYALWELKNWHPINLQTPNKVNLFLYLWDSSCFSLQWQSLSQHSGAVDQKLYTYLKCHKKALIIPISPFSCQENLVTIWRSFFCRNWRLSDRKKNTLKFISAQWRAVKERSKDQDFTKRVQVLPMCSHRVRQCTVNGLHCCRLVLPLHCVSSKYTKKAETGFKHTHGFPSQG